MDAAHLVLLFIAVGLIAFLYSSVGHAGASGYIAVMTLWGLAPTVIRPTALVLNILQHYRGGGGIVVDGVDVFRVDDDGKIVAVSGYSDQSHMRPLS